MGHNPTPLGSKAVRVVVRRLRDLNWTIRNAPSNNGFYCTAPDGQTVVFGRNDARANVYAQFRRAGVELDVRRERHTVRQQRRRSNGPRPPIDERSLAVDTQRPQAPLVDVPLNFQQSISWTDHALGRLNERGVGIFEVYSALHAPDYTTSSTQRADLRHYMRGDLEIVFAPRSNTVVTVIDVSERDRTEPRQPLTPDIIIEPNPAEAEEETMLVDASPRHGAEANGNGHHEGREPLDLSQFPSRTEAVRHLIAAQSGEFGRAALMVGLPQNYGVLVDQVLSRETREGKLVRVGPGRYRASAGPVDVRSVPVEPKAGASPDTMAKAHAVRRGEETPVSKLVYDYIRDELTAGAEFTSALLAEVLPDIHRTSLRTGLRRLVDIGVLNEPVTEGNTHVYKRPGRIRRVLVEGGVVSLANPIAKATTVEPDPEPDPIPEPEPVKPARVVTASEDYSVTLGFEFEELPASDAFDLLDSVNQHRAALVANPWRWSRIATYQGSRAHEIAGMRAAAIDAAVGDASFRFEVKRVSMTEVGLFVAYAPPK